MILQKHIEQLNQINSNNKTPLITNFYWVPALRAKMIGYSFYIRTAWVIAAASGFLNNWASTFESKDSSQKCWHSRNWCGVNGIAALCMLLVRRNWPSCVLQTWTKEKSLTFQQDTEVSCLFLFVWCEKRCVVVFITRSVSWGWLITGPNINPWSQLFQIFVWQAATQQQLL